MPPHRTSLRKYSVGSATGSPPRSPTREERRRSSVQIPDTVSYNLQLANSARDSVETSGKKSPTVSASSDVMTKRTSALVPEVSKDITAIKADTDGADQAQNVAVSDTPVKKERSPSPTTTSSTVTLATATMPLQTENRIRSSAPIKRDPREAASALLSLHNQLNAANSDRKSKSLKAKIVLEIHLHQNDHDALLDAIDRLAWNTYLEDEYWQIKDTGLQELIASIGVMPNLTPEIRTAAKRLAARWEDGVYSNNPTDRWSIGRRRKANFVVGEVFHSQAALVASGIHQNKGWGVWGTDKDGALAILLSNAGYVDIDEGDSIWYSGVISNDDGMAYSTWLLHKRYQKGKDDYKEAPIRVLRSYGADWEERPAGGYRFDGTYYIDQVKPLDTPTAGKGDFHFHLVRYNEWEEPIQHTPRAAELSRLPDKVHAKSRRKRKSKTGAIKAEPTGNPV